MYHYEYGSWYDLGWELPLQAELGTQDQANLVHLDVFEDVVWVGTQRGRLLSYTRARDHWSCYSRFNVSDERVIQILTKPEGVLSLTRNRICFNSRGGVEHALISDKAAARITNGGTLAAMESFHMGQLAAGSGKTLFYLDSLKGELTTFFHLPHAISKIHAADPVLVIGGTNGDLSLVEGRVPKVLATVNAHPSEVVSIASNQQYIYTCGKRHGQLSDVFLKMFDIRNLKNAIPVSVPSGALRVETRGWSVLVLSNHGVWQQADLFPSAHSLRNSEYFKTNCFAPHSPDLSPTVVEWSPREEVCGLLDSAGVVHFWARSEITCPRIAPNVSSSSLLMPVRATPSFPQPVHPGNANTAFDTTPTRVYSDAVREGVWADEWETFFASPTPLRAPLPILPQVAKELKPWDKALAVAPNALPYGQLVALARAEGAKTLTSPSRGGRKVQDDLESRWKYTQIDFSINHSLFPFGLYNKTSRTGLENSPIGFLNPLVQVLFALPFLRQILMAHACDQELCVACELGCLFTAMNAARFSRSKICQPTRLSRVLTRLKIDPARILDRIGEELGRTLPISNDWASPVTQMTIKDEKVSESFVTKDGRKLTLHSVIQYVAQHKGHYVAIVAVADDLDTAARSRSHSSVSEIPEVAKDWILFNDFVVTPSSIAEATDCPNWRQSVLATYVCEEELSQLGYASSASPLSLETFCRDTNLAKGADQTFVPLNTEELEQLVRGELTVALDTEFVAIGLAAMEIREDGSREIGRPGDMTVGRVSVLRVSDDPNMDGVPFIDHYVAMDEADIKDYVTRFSGIRAGDLDPATSPHWLTSSKAIHQKLRFLLDCGTKFVGHGLHTDFRILNLWVPQSSLIDTVDLFHLRGQRFLSLKFLANRLLELSIQGDVHCSIEDAKTALDIYRVYLKLQQEGTVETTIKSLYESGRTLGWK